MNRLRRSWAWLPLFFLTVILVAAAYVRFRGLAHTPMTADQGILYSIALTWVNGGPLPLAANKASAGIMNPPLIEYLIALPMMIRPTLAAAAQFQALLSLLTLLLLYVYSARLFNHRVALLATFLFAFNPWAVHYGRFVWNPNPVPFFSTLMLGSLLLYLTRRAAHPLHLTLVIVAFAAVTQLHLSSLVLAFVLVAVALLFWRRLWRGGWWASLWPLLLGFALALLLYLPYFLYESGVAWADLRAVLPALSGNQQTVAGEVPQARLNAASWRLVQELATGADLHKTNAVWQAAVLPLDWLLVIVRMLLIAGIVYAPVRLALSRRRTAPETPAPASREGRTITYTILALWILVPVLAYLRHTFYLQNYYFLYVWPAPFLLVALLVDDILAWARSQLPAAPSATIHILLGALLLLVGLWQFHVSYIGLMLTSRGDLRPERTLGQVQEVVTHSQELLSRYPQCDLTVVAENSQFEGSTFALVQSFVQPRQVRLLQAGRGYIIPDNCTLYLLVNSDALVDAWLAEAGEVLPEAIQVGQESWAFYYVPGIARPAEPALATWTNGLELLAVDVPQETAGDHLSLTYRWYVSEEPPEVFYHFFNHVLDEQGELVAQLDAAAIDTRNWHQGDRLVTSFEVPLPASNPGQYTVVVGLYTWPDITRIPLTSGADSYEIMSFSR